MKKSAKAYLRSGTVIIAIAIVILLVSVLSAPESQSPADTHSIPQISNSASSDMLDGDNTSENLSDNKIHSNSDESESNTSPTSSEEATNDGTSSSRPISSDVGAGKSEAVKLSDIPAYSGKAYVVINNNIPNFSSSELEAKGYEKYSELDSLGRTKTAIASVGKDTMPKKDEERESISSIYPTGWKQAKYDNISGKYLYNRCHLIGW